MVTEAVQDPITVSRRGHLRLLPLPRRRHFPLLFSYFHGSRSNFRPLLLPRSQALEPRHVSSHRELPCRPRRVHVVLLLQWNQHER